MKRNYIYILGLACIISACIEEQRENVSSVNPGDEVQFSASVNNDAKTKTIYGDEFTDDEGTFVKINWVDNDCIYVYGENCLSDRNQAEYAVAPGFDENEGYSYASSLDKTGDVGVQWGVDPSNFYAIYPSPGSTAEFKTVDGVANINAKINNVQNNLFKQDPTTKVWKGVEINANGKESMQDAIMYAYSENVQQGETAELRFKPFSTVLKFTLDGVRTKNGLGDNATVQVQKIIVTSPNATIAGDFTLGISENGASAQNIQNPSKTITIVPSNENGDFIPVLPHEKIEFNLFVIPTPDMSLEGWTVTIQTSHGSKTITFKDGQLESGMIHKVTVPELATLENNFVFEPDKWVSQLPTDVYLSEISVPGAWYATNPEGYQATTDLETQFNAGIRAFNIDCRLTLNETLNVSDYDGSGNARYQYQDKLQHAVDGTLALVCSGTETEGRSGIFANGKISDIGTTVESALITLGTLISQKPEEFIEVILTVAEAPKKVAQLYEYRYGTLNPQMIIAAIAEVMGKESINKYVYKGKITPETTVGEVAGKMIVKVNLNTNQYIDFKDQTIEIEGKTYVLKSSIPYAHVSYASMALSGYTTSLITIPANNYSKEQHFPMYYQKSESTNLEYWYHQAQQTDYDGSNVTSGIPTLAQRKSAVSAIIAHSYNNYKPNSATPLSAWYQLGIGGSCTENSYDHSDLATDFNKEVYKTVMEKMGYTFISDRTDANGLIDPDVNEDGTYKITEANKKIAPIGIVLMNRCTENACYGPKLRAAILELNAMFYMKRAEQGQ